MREATFAISALALIALGFAIRQHYEQSQSTTAVNHPCEKTAHGRLQNFGGVDSVCVKNHDGTYFWRPINERR